MHYCIQVTVSDLHDVPGPEPGYYWKKRARSVELRQIGAFRHRAATESGGRPGLENAKPQLPAIQGIARGSNWNQNRPVSLKPAQIFHPCLGNPTPGPDNAPFFHHVGLPSCPPRLT